MVEDVNRRVLFVDDTSDTRDNNFDLILLDIDLPDKDGLELCREIRGFDQRTPILFFHGIRRFAR